MPALRALSKLVFSFLFLFPAFGGPAAGQDAEVNIAFTEGSQVARMRVRYPGPAASALTLSRRAEELRNVRLVEGVWSYDIDLAPPKGPAASVRSSWIGKGFALLVLDDLLPHPTRGQTGTITTDLPAGWRIFATDATDLEQTVIVAGNSLRHHRIGVRGSTVDGLVSGEWAFTDHEARAATDEVFRSFTRLFGGAPATRFQVTVAQFPMAVAAGSWEADTRGRSVVIMSSDTAFKSQSLQRLHEQLRHEIFHFWLPNGVNLTGNYDWFYEGFALYQSLKLGVAVNRIRFDDYLDTLTRVYEIDRRTAARRSLTELSADRWTDDNNTLVYARGMLTAFLCDLRMLAATNGRRSSDDLVREIYTRHRTPAAAQDGNSAVLAAMRRYDLGPIADKLVTGAEQIELEAYLRPAGLEYLSGDRSPRLRVIARPSSPQKRLLDRLGYNNWRKLAK